jgi:hypothetical protein
VSLRAPAKQSSWAIITGWPRLDCFVTFAPRNDGATYGSFVILRWPGLRPNALLSATRKSNPSARKAGRKRLKRAVSLVLKLRPVYCEFCELPSIFSDYGDKGPLG